MTIYTIENSCTIKGEELCSKDFTRKVTDFPLHLDIEPTSRCNFNCKFCDKQPLVTLDQLGDMSLELFKKIVDEGSENGLKSIQLSYRGEPLLNKNLTDMICYAKEKKIEHVYFCTNGALLTPKRMDDIITAGLDLIIISVQGANKKEFEKERLGAKFEFVLRNIKILSEIKKTRKLKRPKICLQAVMLPGLNISEMVNFWDQYCDEFRIVKYKDPQACLLNIKTEWVCPQLWERMTIEWNGTILPCNNNDVGSFKLGNANECSLKEAWNGEKMNMLRNMHLKGMSHKVLDCDGCPFRTIQITQI
jgi:radical SAM protein with 4Fe4S-binding SPASM domain